MSDEPRPPARQHDHAHDASGQEQAQERLAHGDEHDSGAHDHAHGHAHEHEHAGGLRGALLSIIRPHSHDSADRVDPVLESSARGLWTVKLSLLALAATALFQLIIVGLSGSVALLGDTIHNFSDALTAIPLGIAFLLGRRAASRRYTYGYGRAEDLAGIAIVVLIAASSVFAGWEALQRLLHPRPITHIPWVILAALAGCLGNELVAVFRIRVGREIGSAALVADGYHARADGLTSLAVLLGALGAAAGLRLADPIVGLGITVAILFVLRDAAAQMWQRLMDAVEPELAQRLAGAAATTPGVVAVEGLRVRWLGHRLEVDLRVLVDEELPTRESHAVAETVRHNLFHVEPRLATAVIHIDPCGHGGGDSHAGTAHHEHAQRPDG